MSELPKNAAGPPRRPRRRRLLWLGAASGTVLLVILLAVFWALTTQPGARWLVQRAAAFAPGDLQIRDVNGTIEGPLELSGVHYRNAGLGVEARIAHVSLDMALPELLSRRVHVSMLDVRGVELRFFERHRTAPRNKEREQPASRAWPAPPIDMALERFTLHDARIYRDGTEPIIVRSANAAGRWTAAEGIAIHELIVASPAGRVRFEGATDPRGWGRAQGAFRWHAAGQWFSGEVVAVRHERQMTLQMSMKSPFDARFDATLSEAPERTWTFSLDVPSFDPRKRLRTDVPLDALAANLEGEGSLRAATVNGSVTINGQPMRIEPLRIAREGQALQVEELTLLDPTGRGMLTAAGAVRFGAAAATSGADAKEAKLFIDLTARWHDVELPEQWVGQPIATQGMLAVSGTPATFTVSGDFTAGPPGYPADISLLIAGAPEEIEVKELVIEEHTGSLTLTGTLRRAPGAHWQFAARARHFDPGRLLVGWPGKLTFALDSSGRMTSQGPVGTFELEQLAGTLRGHPLAGQGALTLREDRIISGRLELRAGQSELRLIGRDSHAMDLDAAIEIAALESWLPRAAGHIKGRFHITGRFPQLAIAGDAEGRGLLLAGYGARSINVTARVQNLTDTTGTVTVTASDIAVAPFGFSSGRLEVSGAGPNHTVQLNLTGQPLTVQLRAQGARQTAGWLGTVDQLRLILAGSEALTLRKATDIYWSPQRFSVSESCLVSAASSACVAASGDEEGELDVHYRLERLPLDLIAALALPASSLRIDGTVDGKGSIRRTSDGALFGDAQIGSDSGRIIDAGVAGQEEVAHTVLTYEHLKGAAHFNGDGALASIEASLGSGGLLAGRVSLENLGSASALVAGDAKVVMPDLAPAGWFVPQLADLRGRGEGSVSVEGPLTDPHLVARVLLRDLAAEVPQAGIQLKNGELDASIDPDTGTTVSGKVESGDGEITVTSATHADGRFEVNVRGRDFVALDLPVARLTLAPDLAIVRSANGLMLTGTVTLPRGRLDLERLPARRSVALASPDVVVVDDEQPTQIARRTPSSADIRVVLGNDVRVFGRGLEAEVRGQLDVHARDNRPTTASGDVYLTGTYASTGPDFTIDQGRLRFDGAEITDPQVNFTATRTTGAVTVTLNVTGRAQAPVVDVSSDPPMSETQALAYLMVGKPLTELTSGEEDMVQIAARSLGTVAGNALAAAVGARLGITDLRIEENPEIGSTLTVGQYFSPRLYLSYGAGLFQPGRLWTMRFHLTDRIAIKAAQGPSNQKAGISWRIER